MKNLLFLLPDQSEILNQNCYDVQSFTDLVLRFAFNILILLLLNRWLYYSSSKRKDYLFTFFIIGSIVFLLSYMLGNAKIGMGFALGLFAIFGIIRYRTDQIPIKEMTYLFLSVAISAINALVGNSISIYGIIFCNLAILFITFGFEKLWLLKHESAKDIVYEKIDMIKPEKYEELLADLKERTGISTIKRVEVGKIDFLRDTCQLKIYYEEAGDHINMADNQPVKSENGDDD